MAGKNAKRADSGQNSIKLTVSRNLLGNFSVLVAGTLGAWLFYRLQLPMPWLLGSIFGVILAARIPRIRLRNPVALANPARSILGLAIGVAFSPELLRHLPQYLLSLSLMIPTLILTIYIGMLYFERIAGLSKHTAFFCALPGGLIEMTMISQAYGADMRRVALIQTTRVLLIVYTVPFAIHHWTNTDLSGSTRLSVSLNEFPPDQAVLLFAAALVGWWVMRKFRLPGAAIVGPMFCSAFIYSAGWVSVRMPDSMILFAQLILGSGIGCAFNRITLRDIAGAVGVTLGYFFILMIVTLGVAFIVHRITQIELVATILAFIPGGQAEMNVIALLVGVAVPYIALHHILRMVLVMTVAPPLSNKLLGAPQRSKNRAGGPN